jgi:hypothetical protein
MTLSRIVCELQLKESKGYAASSLDNDEKNLKWEVLANNDRELYNLEI